MLIRRLALNQLRRFSAVELSPQMDSLPCYRPERMVSRVPC